MYTAHTESDIENCEGWLLPGGHSSGSSTDGLSQRPRFNPRWLPVFHGSLKIFLNLFIMYMYIYIVTSHIGANLGCVQFSPSVYVHVHVNVCTCI